MLSTWLASGEESPKGDIASFSTLIDTHTATSDHFFHRIMSQQNIAIVNKGAFVSHG